MQKYILVQKFVNCFAYGAYNNDFAEQFSSDTIFERNIMIVPFTDLLPDRCCTFENCYYDNEKFINTYISGSKTEDDLSDLKDLNQSCSRTTEQMHSQETYEGLILINIGKCLLTKMMDIHIIFHVKQL
mgnify:CR=1 FL=1